MKSRPYAIGVQLWTVREAWSKEPISTLSRLADLGYEGIELYGDLPLPAQELKAALQSMRLKVAAAHVGSDLDFDLTRRMEEARILGHRHFVWSLPSEAFADDASALAAAKAASSRCEALAREGFSMSLHNHDWEFVSPARGQAYLQACEKVGLEFDLYWLQVAGLNPAAMAGHYASRLKLIHAKDGPAQRGESMTALGDGKVDNAGAIGQAVKAGAPLEWVLVELDRCDTDIWVALRRSKAYLDAMPKT